MMEELLREITCLSAKLNQSKSDGTSSGRETICGQTPRSGTEKAGARKKTFSRKRRGRKRRLEYHPELDFGSHSSYSECSDDEILRDYIENIAANMTDSDEDDVPPQRRNLLSLFPENMYRLPWSPLEMGESDSFSENVMSLNQKKKKRLKRIHRKLKSIRSLDLEGNMAVDSPLASITIPRKVLQPNRTRKCKLKFRNQTSPKVESKQLSDSTSSNIRTTDLPEGNSLSDNQTLDGNVKMECSKTSYDSLDETESSEESESSSDDEADDEAEESCVETNIGSVIPWWDDCVDMEDDQEEKNFQKIMNGSSLLSMQSRRDLQARLRRRGLFSAPRLNENSCSVTYVNRRIQNFLQQRDQDELSINLVGEVELDQVFELAALYSLQCQMDSTPRQRRVMLSKTRNTKEPDSNVLQSFLHREMKSKPPRSRSSSAQRWQSKRRRTTTPEGYVGDIANPIPENNVGSQMLRNMGWTPGTGLGRDGVGIIKPIAAYKRPKNLGLGHPG